MRGGVSGLDLGIGEGWNVLGLEVCRHAFDFFFFFFFSQRNIFSLPLFAFLTIGAFGRPS